MAIVVFIGAIVSLILEVVQQFAKSRKITISREYMLLGLAALSLLGALIKFLAVRFEFWESLISIVASAAAIHNIFIRNADIAKKFLLDGEKYDTP